MKVLHCIQTLPSGGKERRLCELLKKFSEIQDIHCEIVVMSEDIHYEEIFNLDLKINYFLRKQAKDLRFFLDFYKVCVTFKPDIIHCWDVISTFYAGPVSKILRIKLINSMIGNAPSSFTVKDYFFSKITVLFSDIILSNSYAGLKSYNPPQNKSYCIRNGFDFSRLNNIENKKSIKKKFNIKTEKIVGMIASFSDSKDYETYVQAAEKILRKNRNVTFLAIGDGKNIDNIKNLINLSNKENIKFLGRQNDVESIINCFNLGILTTFTEGISNVLIECMAIEKPVITTRCAGTQELVIDGENGFLINQGDVDELVKKINIILENEDLSVKMGKKGKDIVKKNFKISSMVGDTIKLYNSILKSNENYDINENTTN